MKRLTQSSDFAPFTGISGYDQFQTEKEVLSQCDHPAVVKLVGQSSGESACLVYEYLAHGSLDERIQWSTSVLSDFRRLTIVSEVTQGLAYLHDTMEIAHCDISSSNILLCANDSARIGDFGLCVPVQGLEGKSVSAPNPDFIRGAPAYLAPEVFQGRVTIDADMYAFGVVMLELITGLPPVNPEQARKCAGSEERTELPSRLDSRVNWDEKIVMELTFFSEACVDQCPRKRPRARSKIKCLVALVEHLCGNVSI